MMNKDDLIPFKGHVVELLVKKTHVRTRYHDREPEMAKGENGGPKVTTEIIRGAITGFHRDGLPIVEDHHWDRFHLLEIVGCKTLFVPMPNAIKVVCTPCWLKHPLKKCLDTLRVGCAGSSNRRLVCSICNHGKRREWDGFILIPSTYWKINTKMSAEDIESALFEDITMLQFSDYSLSLALKSVELDFARSKGSNHVYEFEWNELQDKKYLRYSSRRVTSYHDEPPTKMQWRELITLHDLKREALEIWIDAAEIWKKETA